MGDNHINPSEFKSFPVPKTSGKVVAFISGHLNITEKEFDEHYKNRIIEAINKGHYFVLGDARGVDAMAQELLSQYFKDTPCNKVIVYHMHYMPRFGLSRFPTRGGYDDDTSRDEAMTLASDYDILWVRPGKEGSGTDLNRIRREKMNRGIEAVAKLQGLNEIELTSALENLSDEDLIKVYEILNGIR